MPVPPREKVSQHLGTPEICCFATYSNSTFHSKTMEPHPAGTSRIQAFMRNMPCLPSSVELLYIKLESLCSVVALYLPPKLIFHILELDGGVGCVLSVDMFVVKVVWGSDVLIVVQHVPLLDHIEAYPKPK